MQKHFSTFAGGKHGIGLLILRTTAGVASASFGGIILSRLGMLAANQVSYVCNLVLGLLLISGGIFLMLGLMTPSVSITLTGCHLISAYISLTVPYLGKRFGWVAPSLLAGIALALVFLGPGAYSIDARLFGRRRIVIPSSKREKSQWS